MTPEKRESYRSLLEARGGSGWLTTGPDKGFSEARWWELTLLPMLAYMLWAVFYYIKVGTHPQESEIS
jgi:hypothetical protein